MLDKEVRKIQLTGKTTYIVSLPKRWVESFGLTNGSLVTLIKQPNNSLLILPDLDSKPSNIEEVVLLIPENKSGESVKRRIVSAYLAGYNVIHVRNKNGIITPKQRDAIREVVRRNLVSTEIIADSSNLITIQVLTSLPELSVKSVLRRMFLIASAMHKDAIIALKELNKDLAYSVINSDDEVDKFSLYMMRNLVLATHSERALRDMGLLRLSDTLGYRVVVKSIERIADHACSIADRVKEFNSKPSSNVMSKIEDMSNYVLSIFEDSIEALLRRDYELADAVADKADVAKVMEKDILSLISNDPNLSNYKLILEDIRRVAEYSSDISEVAINHTIDEIIVI